MTMIQGERAPETRKGRPVLTRRDPYILKLVAGLDAGANIDELLRFSKQCWAERDEWDIARRQRGLFGSKLLTRDEADRALRLQLTAQAAGGGE